MPTNLTSSNAVSFTSSGEMMNRYLVALQIQTSQPLAVTEAAVKRDAERILKTMGWTRAALSLVLTDDEGIRPVHKEFLNDDSPTDVISFSQLEGEGPQPLWEGLVFLGDLVISAETASREAARRGHSLRYELCFYICHGLLHFEGFDDRTPALRRRMFRIQEAVLAAAGIRK